MKNTKIVLLLVAAALTIGTWEVLGGPSHRTWEKLPTPESSLPRIQSDERSWTTFLSDDEAGLTPECKRSTESKDQSREILLGCDTILIACADSQQTVQNDLNGYCNQNCEMVLPPNTCMDLGLQARKYPRQEVREVVSKFQPRAYDEMWQACAVSHQLRHLSDGLLRPHCMFEYRGQLEQLICLQQYQAAYCDTRSPRLEKQECQRLAEGICYVRASQKLQACRCQHTIGSNSSCDQCAEECKPLLSACYSAIEGSSLAATQGATNCAQVAGLYCKNNRFH